MHPIITQNRLVFGGLGLIFSLLLFALLATVAQAASTDNELPVGFTLPVGHHALFSAPASGDDVYECAGAGDGYAWQLRGANAKLLDSDNHLFATQNGASSWLAIDGSEISGRVVKATGAYGDALYTVTANTSGGVFGEITEVVRYHVTGGQPPTEACERSALHRSVRVPFTADYIFFQAES